MTTLTVFLINLHAHLIFFVNSGPVSEISKKLTYCMYLHCRTHFTKVTLAKTL
jgi:hypothetical protein